MTRDCVHPPESGATLTMEWRTWVNTTRDGTEQRAKAGRENPRWALSFPIVLLTEAKARALRWDLQQGIDETWRVPVWIDGVRITTAAASGQANIIGDYTTSDIAATDLVYVHHRNGQSGEFGTVSSINSTTLTLGSNLGASYPVGSHVYLALSGLLTEGQGMARANVAAASMTLELHASATRAPGGTGGTALTEYQSLPVLDRYPVGSSFDESVMSGMERIDFGGAFSNANQYDVFRNLYRRRIRLGTRAELQWFRLLLASLNGMRDVFWVPTFRPDFDVVTAAASATEITVDDSSGHVAAWFAGSAERHVQIEHTDGTVYYREVTAATPSGNNSVLTIDSANPVALADMNALSLLQLCRLGSDTVRIETQHGRSYADVVVRTLDEVAA